VGSDVSPPAPGAVGLIGLGEIGQVHASAIQGSRTARLVAVADAGLESLFVGYRSGPALSMFRDRQWQEVPVRLDDWPTSVQASVMAYLDAVTAGREPPVTGAAALETISLFAAHL
jgi:predicted dehydrogenase